MAVPGESPLLSVLIATLAHREDRFLRLLGMLLPQAEMSPAGVEVLALQNNGSERLATYRDRLLQAARGRYLCFVDDDDMVPPFYVEKITGALAQEPDCVGFRQVCSGTDAMLSELSMRHRDPPWAPVMYNGQFTYLREFNHAMPVLSSLAQQASFQGCVLPSTGEDMMYVAQLLPLLRERGCREVFIDAVLYHYIWSTGDTTQNGAQSWGYRARYQGHLRPQVVSKCFRWVE